MDDRRLARIRWRCRRGLLELDIVLSRYLARLDESAADCAELMELLELPDNDLWDIVAGRSDEYAPHLREMVARLRAA